jgi:hypothetical protein
MIQPSRLGRLNTRRAAVSIWLLLGLGAIIGVVALGMDGGRLMDERRHAQAAADAIALAAATDLYHNYWQTFGKDVNGTAAAAGMTIAASNGYSNDGVTNIVTINTPPLSGSYVGQAGYVEVIVQSNLSAGFSKIFTFEDLPVQARSVALGLPLKIGLILLRKSGASALLNNSPALTLINGSIIVDSNDPAAYNQSSFGAVIANNIRVTGNYINPGSALILAKLRTGVRPTLDPLAYLPVPDMSGATVRSTSPLVVNSLLPTVLSPGVYQGGIQVKGLSSVIMTSGNYFMDGGGFQVGDSATVTGLNVMVYNTAVSYPAGSIELSSLGKIVMTSPQSGTYQGINFFQNRSLTQPISITGYGLSAIQGVIYAAQAPVKLTGNGTLGVDILGGAYVCDSMQIQGLGGININLGLNPPRVPEIHLVE